MALKHNKKRNSGMLSEFFAMQIADFIVSRNYNKVAVTKKLWNKYVHSGTELQKEMALFDAIRSKTFKNKQVAYDLLSKVKLAAKKLNQEKLDREKTSLIREAKNMFGDEFFNKSINSYTQLASIQILLNHCSSKNLFEGVINPAMAELEDKILGFMMVERQEPKYDLDEILGMTEEDVDGLVVNIMREKVDKKFSPRLTEDQKKILQQFVFDDDKSNLKETLENLRDETLGLIKEELIVKNPPKLERDKLNNIHELLQKDYHDVSNLNETMVEFYMTVSKLNDELKDEE